jgi:hypothetical protein
MVDKNSRVLRALDKLPAMLTLTGFGFFAVPELMFIGVILAFCLFEMVAAGFGDSAHAIRAYTSRVGGGLNAVFLVLCALVALRVARDRATRVYVAMLRFIYTPRYARRMRLGNGHRARPWQRRP